MENNFAIPERVKNEIADYAKKYGVEKVILFGSRARGTNSERSDIDIAVKGGNFGEFCFAVEEQVNTLLMFDVVDLNSCKSDELLSEIERDGVVIYEKI
ncbi:MAG: nucleotidyltransferase domain-containing protein [Prevotella sp.]|nr:nucleotidyltransferase domain-containing protein [Prevotella sp.]